MASTTTTSSAKSLPHLLSLLPKNGQSALVRPSSWPSTSFYRITRSKLKFRAPPTPSTSTSGGSSASSSSSATAPAGGVGSEGLDGEGSLKAFGKAWGMLYRDGKYRKPSSPLANPDSEIRQGLKKRWIEVDPRTLSTVAQQSLAEADGVLTNGRKERLSTLGQRRAEKRLRKNESQETK